MMLQVKDIDVYYDKVQALFGVSIEVNQVVLHIKVDHPQEAVSSVDHGSVFILIILQDAVELLIACSRIDDIHAVNMAAEKQFYIGVPLDHLA